jgi:DNA-binding NtrC family response regulator
MSPDRHVSGGDTAILPTTVAPPPSPLSIMPFSLETGPSDGARTLTGPLTVGRDASCTLSCDDAALSRIHAELVPDGANRVLVIDRDSRNGTFVDGQRVRRGHAGLNSIIRVGNTFLRLARLTESWEAARREGPLVGGSALAPVRRLISLVGPTEMPVLILGETGTGKEVVARLIHAASSRRGSFIAVNCAALPEPLVESELFGHARGAFTGAGLERKGLFSIAAGGTLFLDEVGDMPLGAQAKLLRVLEDGMVRPVGAETARKVDVRVISATNRDLAGAVLQSRFRADLLARLATVELRLPSLRERPEDLPALAAHLLARAGHAGLSLTGDALEAMALHDWPQNVRELDNALRQAALTNPSQIDLAELPSRVQERLARARVPATAATASDGEVTRERLERALSEHHGNVRRAAQSLGIARGHFYRLLERWNVDPNLFRNRHEDC